MRYAHVSFRFETFIENMSQSFFTFHTRVQCSLFTVHLQYHLAANLRLFVIFLF